MPRFSHTYCSQCGDEFGPGDEGYSHCADHASSRLTERDSFEAWAANEGFSLRRMDTFDGESYRDLRTQGAWDAWQACVACAKLKAADGVPGTVTLPTGDVLREGVDYERAHGVPACLCGQPISEKCKANGCRWDKEKKHG